MFRRLATVLLFFAVVHPATALIGGLPVPEDKYPWVVAIVDQAGSNQSSLCHTGALVHSEWVITAASCVMSADTGLPSNPSGIQIVTGRTSLSETDGEIIQAKRVEIPNSYGEVKSNSDPGNAPYSPRWYSPDIALIKLSRPSTAPIADIAVADAAGVAARIVGYGRTTFGGGTRNNQHELSNEILTEHSSCDDRWSRYWIGYDTVAGNVLCTTSPVDQGSCGGDRSSILFAVNPNDTSRAVVYGALSFAAVSDYTACDGSSWDALNHGLAFSRFSLHLDWINETINSPDPIGRAKSSFTRRCNANNCVFDGRGSSTENGSIESWDWTIDENAYSGPVVSIRLPVGYRSAALKVIDDVGATDTSRQSFFIGGVSTGVKKRKLTKTTNRRLRRVFFPRKAFIANDGMITGRLRSTPGSVHTLTLMKRDETTRRLRPVRVVGGVRRGKVITYRAKAGYYRWIIQSAAKPGRFTLTTTNR